MHIEGNIVLPSAPPEIPGYEDASYDPVQVRPPAYVPPAEPTMPPPPYTEMKALTDGEIREALKEFVDDHCCYGNGPVTELLITGTYTTSCNRYTLETYGESRETKWKFKPYRRGDYVDGPENGRAPGPWEVPAFPTALFRDEETSKIVPHTSTVRTCTGCGGSGRVTCFGCSGRGRASCYCSSNDRSNCTRCHGAGSYTCTYCGGSGRRICTTCDGEGKLLHYLKLYVKWKNHIADHIGNYPSKLPAKKVRMASGTLAFEEQHRVVAPVIYFPDAETVAVSSTFLRDHQTAFCEERILQQRHRIRIIPITDVWFQWRKRFGCFSVYGLENKVYFPDYPVWCCGCCSIL